MSNPEKIFYPFIKSHNKDNWAGYVSPRMGFFNMDIPDVSFGTGFLVGNRYGVMDLPHVHDGAYNFFIFTGADLDNIFDAPFEAEFFLGENGQELEQYNINKPTFVIAPPGVYHSPIYFKKVYKGFNSMIQYSGHESRRIYSDVDENGEEVERVAKSNVTPCIKDPSKLCTFCGLCFTDANETEQDAIDKMAPIHAKVVNTEKFKKYVYELKKDYHNLGDAVMNPRLSFKGREELDEAEYQFSFNIITKPCKLGDDEPVSNGQVAEFLWFSGTDVTDSWATFDAEIEVMVGDDPDNMKPITFSEPGVIAIPPGMWRGPITVKRADKPICFMPWYPHTKPRYKITRKMVDGKPVLVYDDETTITNPTAGDELFMQIKR